MAKLSSDFYNNIITTNIQVIDCLINCLTLQESRGDLICNTTAITASTALLNRSADLEENHKLILTQLFVQKLLSQEFKKQLGSLLSPRQVKNYKTLALLCKVCEGSKEMCTVIVDNKEYVNTLAVNFRELVTQSESTDMKGLEEWILHVTVLWCILRCRQQDISEQ